MGDGFSVFLRIVEWRSDDTLPIPLSAIFRNGEGWAVFAVEDGTARLLPVELGHRAARLAEVLEGLEPGMQIVTHPSDELEDGVAVVLR